MASQHTLESQQSLPATALAGCWKLEAGHATTLQPHQAGVFRVSQGAVWVTLDGPHRGAANQQGDQVLLAGDALTLRPGQRAVVEPWFIGSIEQASPPAYFRWEPVAEGERSGSRSRAEATAQWHRGVVEPVHELALALGLASGALGRLTLGLAQSLGLRMPGRRGGPTVVHLN